MQQTCRRNGDHEKAKYHCVLHRSFHSYESFFATYIQAEESHEIHRFLDIPFDTSTPETVRQVLLEKEGVQISIEAFETWIYGINEFGYPLCALFNFGSRGIGITRILLNSAQPARVEPDQFPLRFRSDMRQFIDMDAQLTALYGQPDIRYFEGSSRYMFRDNK